jgi:hypothetical protein
MLTVKQNVFAEFFETIKMKKGVILFCNDFRKAITEMN